jgi:thioredoxin 2
MAAPTTATSVVQCARCGKRNRVPAAASGTPVCGNCKSALPWIADAGDDDYTRIVEQSPCPVVVDLWAPWCGPCRMVTPALEQVARELAGRIKLVTVNVDNAPRLSQRFEVQAVPTLLLVSGGEVVARQAGAAPAATLRAWIENHL